MTYPNTKLRIMSSMKPAADIVLLTAVLIILLQLLTAHVAAAAAVNTATSYPDFQLLHVKQTVARLARPNPEMQHADNHDQYDHHNELGHSTSWKLRLLHRDRLSSTSHHHHDQNHTSRFLARMKRDIIRVATLTHRLSTANYQTQDFGSDVVSGMEQGSGEYFVRVGVGSPPRSQYMVIDSGSDVVWVQCKPCSQCYKQTDPLFDPSASSTYAGVLCSSSVCDRFQNTGCHQGHCGYEVDYGDGSFTKGTLALEMLSFGETTVRDVAIGCGHVNQGMFTGAAGLLGLGGGTMSFVGQLSGQTGGAFSYCLVSRGSGSPGSLEFGRGAMPVGAAWVPLVRNSRAPSFYYIGLSGLGVGATRIPVAEEVFRMTESGNGGVVMDTGTAVTRLTPAAYGAFRDEFVAQTLNLPRASSVSIFDTCYNLSGFISVRVPTVSLYMSGGPILTLPAKNFLIPVDNVGTFCFAFAPSAASGLSIIGNIQQEGIQISIDGPGGFLGFGPNVC